MTSPARGLTPQETTSFVAELEQRWREAGDGEKERLAWVSDLLVKVFAEGVQTAFPREGSTTIETRAER